MFDFALVIESLPEIAQGIGLTLQLLILSLLFGTVLGVVTVLMRISGSILLSWPAFIYIYIFRGTPMLVQLFVIYYGVAQFEWIRDSLFWPFLRDPYWCAILALTLNGGAYMAEIFRGGIQGVDKGLQEAASAIGLSKRQRFTYITAPIAIRLSLHAYSNEIISLLKATALASTITMNDMTGVARTIVAKTFAPYEIFISAAIVYLMMTWVIQTGVSVVEGRLNRYIVRPGG